MIDTLLHYSPTLTRSATKPQIIAELEALGLARNGVLDDSVCCWVSLITQRATWDANGALVTPLATLDGIALWVTTDTARDDLWNMSGNVARLQADRVKNLAGDKTWLIRTRVAPAMLSSVQIDPIFAGTDYSFSDL